MGTRWPIVRKVTNDMFNCQKWVLLIRDNALDEWRSFGNKISGKPYIYQNLDNALHALKNIQNGRYKMGNAKLVKMEDLDLHSTEMRQRVKTNDKCNDL